MIDPYSFTGLDKLVNDKKKTAEQLRQEKAARLSKKLEEYGISGTVVKQFDADTYSVQLPDGSQQILRASGGFDAPDSAFRDTPEGQSKFQHQREALNQITGIPTDQITPDDLAIWKEKITGQAAERGFGVGDQVTYVPTGEESLAKGDTRSIAEIYNKDQQRLSNLFDTPLANTAYSAPFNRAKREQDMVREQQLRDASRDIRGFQSGWDEKGNARTVLQPDNTYSYGNFHGLTASEVPSVSELEKSNISNAEPGTLLNTLGGIAASAAEVVKPLYEKVHTWINNPDTSTLSLNLYDTTFDSKDIEAYLDIVENNKLNDPSYTPTTKERDFINSGKFWDIAKVHDDVKYNREAKKVIGKQFQQLRNELYASGLDTRYEKEFDKTYNDEGFLAATGELLVNHPLHGLDTVVQSLPQMASTMFGVGLVNMALDKYEQAIIARSEREKRELTEEELTIAKTAAVVATAFERLGAETLLAKLPGIDKLAIGLAKKSSIASWILTPVAKLGTVAVGEAISEIGTSAAEQYAEKQDISKIDTGELAYSGAIGALGGAGIKAPSATKELFTSTESRINKQIKDINDKLSDTVGTNDADIDKYTAKVAALNAKLATAKEAKKPKIQANIDTLQERINVLKESNQQVPNPNAVPEAQRAKLEARKEQLISVLAEKGKKPAAKAVTPEDTKKTILAQAEVVKTKLSEATDVDTKINTALQLKQVVDNLTSLNDPSVQSTISELAGIINTTVEEVSQTPEVKDAAATAEAAKKEETILYSLPTPDSTTQAQETKSFTQSVIDSLTASPEKKAVAEARNKVQDSAQALADILSTPDTQKTLAEVAQEVKHDIDGEKESFDSLIKKLQSPESALTGMTKLVNLAKIMSDKAKTASKLYAEALQDGTTKYMYFETSGAGTKGFYRESDTPVANKKNIAIHKNSGVLVEAIKAEAEYGQSVSEFGAAIRADLGSKVETQSPIEESIATLTELTSTVKEPTGSIEDLATALTDFTPSETVSEPVEATTEPEPTVAKETTVTPPTEPKKAPQPESDQEVEKEVSATSKSLTKFLTELGFEVKPITEELDKAGIDALGFADLVNRIAYVDFKDFDQGLLEAVIPVLRTVVLSDPSNKSLKNGLFESVIHTPEWAAIKNKDLKSAEQHIQIIDKYLLDALKNPEKYREPKNAFTRGIAKLVKAVLYIPERTKELINVLNKSTAAVFSGNLESLLQAKSGIKLDLDTIFKQNPLEAAIIKKFSAQGEFILTGSAALAPQGSIYRAADNLLHDIDFTYIGDKANAGEKMLGIVRSILGYKNPESVKFIRSFNTETNGGYHTDTLVVAKEEGYTISDMNLVEKDGFTYLNAYNVLDAQGNIVETYEGGKTPIRRNSNNEVITDGQSKVSHIDFFTNNEQRRKEASATVDGATILLTNWKDIIEAKLQMSRPKDLNDIVWFRPTNTAKQSVTPEFDKLPEYQEGQKTLKKVPETKSPDSFKDVIIRSKDDLRNIFGSRLFSNGELLPLAEIDVKDLANAAKLLGLCK